MIFVPVAPVMSLMTLWICRFICVSTGSTGTKIIDAILAGERDPYQLADLKDRRIKADKETIAKSLTGDYRREHLFTLKQTVDSYRHCLQLIRDCDAEIESYLKLDHQVFLR